MRPLAVIDDAVQFRRKSTPNVFIFLKAECGRIDDIVFVATTERWDSVKCDLVLVEEKRISAVDFSAWWLETLRAGWGVNWRRRR